MSYWGDDGLASLKAWRSLGIVPPDRAGITRPVPENSERPQPWPSPRGVAGNTGNEFVGGRFECGPVSDDEASPDLGVALFFFPLASCFFGGSASHLFDAALRIFLLVFLFPAFQIVRNAAMNDFVADLELVLVRVVSFRHEKALRSRMEPP